MSVPVPRSGSFRLTRKCGYKLIHRTGHPRYIPHVLLRMLHVTEWWFVAGISGGIAVNQVCSFSFANETWSQVPTGPSPTGPPGARAHSGYDVDQSCGTLAITFGDHDDALDVATTALLNLFSSPQFSRLSARALPPPRRHAPLVFDPQTRTLFTFGGVHGSNTSLVSFTVINLHHDVFVLPNGHWIALANTTNDFIDLPGFPGVLASSGTLYWTSMLPETLCGPGRPLITWM